MSLSGPASNLLLVLLAAGLIRIGIAAEIFLEPDTINFTRLVVAADESGMFAAVAVILSITFSLNLLLFVFNLLPFTPLDGSGALPLFLKEEHAARYTSFINHSGFAFFGLFVAWNIFNQVFDPIHLVAVNLLYPGAGFH